MNRIVAVVFINLMLLINSVGVFSAETEKENAGENKKQTIVIPETLISPRATMETFLHAMNDIKRGDSSRIEDAIVTLDLGDINPIVRKEVGIDKAWLLLEVMDRTRYINIEKIPETIEGNIWEFESYQQGKVTMSFIPDKGWLFSRETVRTIESVLDELSNKKRVEGKDASKDNKYLPIYLRIRSFFPEQLKQKAFILENWQWMGLLIIVAIGLLADKLASISIISLTRRWLVRRESSAYKKVPDNILRPLSLMLMAAVWWSGLNMLGLPAEVLLLLLVSVKMLVAISGVWSAYRLMDVFTAYLWSKAEKTESKLDDALVPLVSKTFKVFISVLGIVFVADNLNIDVTSLLAGLGLGGLAFALAAKDVVGNLFGSVTVLLDRTFHVGDWVIVDGVEGSVENIGFRSTRIRSFYNSLITIPNSSFITAKVDNMGERTYRRLKCTLSLTYDTPPERIEAYCEGVRELVRIHPYMRKDYYHVYFNGFGNSGLDILVYVFWLAPDWGTELRERHRFLLDCLRLAERVGVEFAFPSRTLYMKDVGDSEIIPAQGDFVPSMSEDDAKQAGRTQAENIVKATTGLSNRPPPVRY